MQRISVADTTRNGEGRATVRLNSFPRLDFGSYPTPIEELSRLRAALGAGSPRLFIKRDDYTGFAFGGNKIRKLEYMFARTVADKAEIVITIAGEKSNHARIVAAVCAKLGLRCILVLNHDATKDAASKSIPASLYLYELFGAEIYRVGSRAERIPKMREIADELRLQGKRVAEIPLGGSVPLGALGFVRAAGEVKKQLDRLGVEPNFIFHASTSGGTQAGLAVGCHLFGMNDAKIVGVSPDDSSDIISAEITKIIKGTRELLELPPCSDCELVKVSDEFVGSGYGDDTPESTAAMRLLAKTEGIVLDPVYTAKAMAALLDSIAKGFITENDTALFWHTGGQLAKFYALEEQSL